MSKGSLERQLQDLASQIESAVIADRRQARTDHLSPVVSGGQKAFPGVAAIVAMAGLLVAIGAVVVASRGDERLALQTSGQSEVSEVVIDDSTGVELTLRVEVLVDRLEAAVRLTNHGSVSRWIPNSNCGTPAAAVVAGATPQVRGATLDEARIRLLGQPETFESAGPNEFCYRSGSVEIHPGTTVETTYRWRPGSDSGYLPAEVSAEVEVFPTQADIPINPKMLHASVELPDDLKLSSGELSTARVKAVELALQHPQVVSLLESIAPDDLAFADIDSVDGRWQIRLGPVAQPIEVVVAGEPLQVVSVGELSGTQPATQPND
jgi:hypothetical protein